MPKFRYSLDGGTTWIVVDDDLPFSIPSDAEDEVLVEAIGDTQTVPAETDELAAPVNTVAPTLSPSGTQDTGTLLTATTGTWTGNPTPTYAYQWLRGGTNISGATSSTYTLQVADEGQTITCRVTGTNSEGSANATTSNSATGQSASTSDDPSTIMGANSVSWMDVSLGGMFTDLGVTPASPNDLVRQIPDQEGGVLQSYSIGSRSPYEVDAGVHYIALAPTQTYEKTISAGTQQYFVAAVRWVAQGSNSFTAHFMHTSSSATDTAEYLSLASRSLASVNFGTNTRVQARLDDQVGPVSANATPWLQDGQWHVVEAIFNGLDVAVSIDGETDVTATGTTALASSVLLAIGSMRQGTNVFDDGAQIDMAAMALANTVPTSGQRTDMRAWAASKFS